MGLSQVIDIDRASMPVGIFHRQVFGEARACSAFGEMPGEADRTVKTGNSRGAGTRVRSRAWIGSRAWNNAGAVTQEMLIDIGTHTGQGRSLIVRDKLRVATSIVSRSEPCPGHPAHGMCVKVGNQLAHIGRLAVILAALSRHDGEGRCQEAERGVPVGWLFAAIRIGMGVEGDIGTINYTFTTADNLGHIVAPVNASHQYQVICPGSAYSANKSLFADASIAVGLGACAGADG